MLSPDFLAPLDATIRDQEATIRVLDDFLKKLKENAVKKEPTVLKKKAMKPKVMKISRKVQCETFETPKESLFVQTDDPELNFTGASNTEVLTVKIVNEEDKSKKGCPFCAEHEPEVKFTPRTLPIFQKIRGGQETINSGDFLPFKAFESPVAFHFSETKENDIKSIWNGTPASFGTMPNPVHELTKEEQPTLTPLSYAKTAKPNGNAVVSSTEFPPLAPVANPIPNGCDVALIKQMRLTKPHYEIAVPKSSSVSSRSTSPTPSQNSIEPATHKKERLIITNVEERSRSLLQNIVHKFCKMFDVEKNKVRDVESITVGGRPG
ncbi:hypothetical protein L596_023830 [Steinernema carpocapsae]|uniref:Uncharacterized protein n=1 Tax=Steinernema carpocapsae TaxID=34508 RepID=A0A4U5MEX1_STECR|nr:hypothetical protein L596_023830 [Steinernema carpocapsae]